MHTIIPSHSPSDHSAPENRPAYLQPHFECSDLPSALKLVVLVPGVEPKGMEITTCGPDLVVTASKAHIVRVNWQALHLEGVQHDYQLRLRLGYDINFDALQADLREGVLTIVAPKRVSTSGRHTQHPQLVA
jgi:HSP20 family molecular chaperone IbpA